MSIGVIINDIYIKEDEKILVNLGVLFESCIIGVEIGGCFYIVICEDVFMNFVVIDELLECYDDIELIFIEFGGDNLVVIFSLEFVDFLIYIIDVV